MSSITKEEFKARIISELNRENSVLKYLIRGTNSTGEYFLRRVTCSEFELDIEITPIDGYQYAIQFVEYAPGKYKLDTTLVDLSDEEYISHSVHAIETIDYWDDVIRFGLLRQQITHTDYQFTFKEPLWPAYCKYARFYPSQMHHCRDFMGELYDLIRFCEKEKKIALLYHEYHYSEKDRKLLEGMGLPDGITKSKKSHFYNIFSDTVSSKPLRSQPSNMVNILNKLMKLSELIKE